MAMTKRAPRAPKPPMGKNPGPMGPTRASGSGTPKRPSVPGKIGGAPKPIGAPSMGKPLPGSPIAQKPGSGPRPMPGPKKPR